MMFDHVALGNHKIIDERMRYLSKIALQALYTPPQIPFVSDFTLLPAQYLFKRQIQLIREV